MSKSKTEAGNTIYKDIKDRLLHIMGPKEQDLYRKAASLVMVDTPSQLARAMFDLLCKCGPNNPLNGCCGKAIISGMWRDKLPDLVRAAVASLKLGGTSLEATVKQADDIFLALNAAKVQVSAITDATGASATGALSSDIVAAVSTQGQYQRGRGRAGRGRGGTNRGTKNNNASAKPQGTVITPRWGL